MPCANSPVLPEKTKLKECLTRLATIPVTGKMKKKKKKKWKWQSCSYPWARDLMAALGACLKSHSGGGHGMHCHDHPRGWKQLKWHRKCWMWDGTVRATMSVAEVTFPCWIEKPGKQPCTHGSCYCTTTMPFIS